MPPRYPGGKGFGGGFDDKVKAGFQPGTEEGVTDPTANVQWSKATGFAMTAHTADSFSMTAHTADSFSMTAHAASGFGMNPNG